MADLVTLAEVKLYMDITDDTIDGFLGSMITRMSAYADTYCNRIFNQATYTEYHDGIEYNDGTLILKNWPVSSVTSVHDDNLRAFGSASLIAATKYVLDDSGANGVLQLLNSLTFGIGRQSIQTIYTAGYVTPGGAAVSTVPEDLKQAIIELVSVKYRHKGKQGIKSERLGRWSATYGSTTSAASAALGKIPVTADATEILDRYKDRRVFML